MIAREQAVKEILDIINSMSEFEKLSHMPCLDGQTITPRTMGAFIQTGVHLGSQIVGRYQALSEK